MMKFIRYFYLLVFIQMALFAQNSLNEELERLKSNPKIKVEYLDGNRILVNYSNLKTRVFNLGENTEQKNYADTIPRFAFNLWELDTSLFNYKYHFWQEVPVASSFLKPVLGDVNNNIKVEIYGPIKDFYTERSEVWCYEQDLDAIFKPAYKYPANTVFAYGIFNIDRVKNKELHILATHLDTASGYIVHDQTFFKMPFVDSLATQFYFDYNIYNSDGFHIQLDDFTFGDFNSDGIIEAVFFSFSPQENWLVKFNEAESTFDSVLAYPTWYYPGVGNESVAGFVVGDFDMDNKADIVYSSGYGNIYVLECEGADNYSINWEGNSGIWNSYINFQTNDIDGNGKPEFWIGGESFSQGVARLFCYESDSNNSYVPVTQIEFPGLVSLSVSNGMSIDTDCDGKEELFIKIGNVIVIIKFTGMPNNHKYEIYYYRQFENVVQAAIMYKFPSSKYPSIVLSMYHSQNGWTRDFSQIFQHYLTTNVVDEEIKETTYQLFINYPNPFNPSTNIKFSMPERGDVKIKVYNSIGEEIITLLNQTLERGEHTVIWNGTNKNNSAVPSGIFFISMEAGSFHKTIKCVLIK